MRRHKKIGLGNATFTFITDVHGSVSWLEHCVVTEGAWQSVVDVKVHYDCSWSDHVPLDISINVCV